MHTLPDTTLAAIGRMTVAAADLELLVEWAGTQDGLDRPAEAARTPLLIARNAVRRLCSDGTVADFDELTAQLVRSHDWLREQAAAVTR